VDDCYHFRPIPGVDEPDWDERIFIYTPLHDYEAVWWITIWVIFSCTLTTADDNANHQQREAKRRLFSNRPDTFVRDAFKVLRGHLPKALDSLCDHLEVMRRVLRGMYSDYEKNFDGSAILNIVPRLVAALQDLAKAAKGIDINPPHSLITVNRSDQRVQRQEAPCSNIPDDNATPGTNWRKRRHGGSMGPEHPGAKRRMEDYGP